MGLSSVGRDVGGFVQRRLLRLIEEHCKDVPTGGIVERAHSHIDVGQSGAAREFHAFRIDAFAMSQRLKERSLKLQPQLGIDQGEQIVRRFTADVSEEPADSSDICRISPSRSISTLGGA